ncbi:serine/threonine-protein phosphatase 6 regulatory ankyrin repeat subunit A-like [Rhopilema esculentum]|uniref:serine/threonine-protein phosphatase 6 regulatory ankyrin repeat subunit A-like n=1 Tax=Rhopilema esculentum TaxID=499914 RepID=UPI0031CF0986
MAEPPIEKPQKIKRRSRSIQASRKTSRVYELAVAAFNAAKYGNIDDLKHVLSRESCQTREEFGSLIESKDKEGNTLILKCIHGAASRQGEAHSNFVECVRFLVSNGVDIDAQDSVGRTALHWCVLYGRADFLEILLKAGGDLMLLDGTGLSPLHLAIGIRSEKLRYKFIDFICQSARKEVIDGTDGHNRTPLYLALSVSAFETFELLLAAKSDPNGAGPDMRRIIVHSIEKGLGKFTELLLKASCFFIKRFCFVCIKHTIILFCVTGMGVSLASLSSPSLSSSALFCTDYQHGASLSTKDPDGFTTIHLAACQENPESIYILTKTVNKTLLNVKDKLGRTPLIYACLMGFDKNVELLLAQKIWTLDQDNEGKTALHHTVNNTHCGCVDLLCKENKKIIHIVDEEGHTAAHDAVIAGNVTVLSALLQNGCDVATKDLTGHSLMHWATAYATLGCFQKLLEFKVPLDEVDGHGATPLHYGCQIDESDKLNDERCEIVRTLLHRGVSMNAGDSEGRKPIHWAASSGNVEILKILLENGDDPNARTSSELMTPLHLVALQGLESAADFLINQYSTRPVEVDPHDQRNCTPLFYACSAGHARVAGMLLQSGADPNLVNDLGESPSHSASLTGSLECLRLLFAAGANMTVHNNEKDTPLHEAASAGKEDCVNFLLQCGCPATVKNTNGATPLHYSVAEGYFQITKALLESGASPNSLVTTNETDFVTPLDIALGNSDHEQIQLLQSFGARTGHSIVDNSALVIQHRWRIFKRRFSNVDSIYRSNLSDSVSSYERREGPKLETSEFSTNLRIKDHSELRSHAFDGEEMVGNKVSEHLSSVDENVTAERDGLVKEQPVKRQNHLTTVKENSVSCGSPDSSEADFQIEEDPFCDIDAVNEMKKLVKERIASNRTELSRSDQLRVRLQQLRSKLSNVVEDINNIASSKEFQIIARHNERISRQQQQQHIPPTCRLPRVSPSSQKR